MWAISRTPGPEGLCKPARPSRNSALLSNRILVIGWVFTLLFGGVILRLFDLQITRGSEYRGRALAPAVEPTSLPALRGALLSRDGEPLARDLIGGVVEINPSLYRERSLVHAVADLLWLLSVPPHATPKDCLAAVRAKPLESAQQILGTPASTLLTDSQVLAERGAALLYPHGALLRSPPECEARLRAACEVVVGDGRRIRRRELRSLGAEVGSLARALPMEPRSLGLRLLTELRLEEELGRAVGFRDAEEIQQAIEASFARESQWVFERLEHELRDAAALDRLGSARLDRLFHSPEELRAFAASLSAHPQDPLEAEAAISADDALRAGQLPPLLTDEALAEAAKTRDSVGEAARRGLFTGDSEALLEAWWRRERTQPDFDPEEHLGPRRRRELLARYRGARSFRFGARSTGDVAGLIVGPGRLERVGFRQAPAFRRDESILQGLPLGLQLLVGEVAPETGLPRGGFGLEFANQRRLHGRPGLGSGAVPERPPEHGNDQSTTLSIPLCRKLEAVLKTAAFDDPAAIAVVHVATGEVLGLATWPLPSDLRTALLERSERDDEIRWLRQFLRRGEGMTTQRHLWLQSLVVPNESERRERDFLAFALDRPRDWAPARLSDLQKKQARSGSYHRAVDSSEHFPPGSVFKALTLLAGLEAGVVNRHTIVDCVDTERRPYHRCHDHGAKIDVRAALEKSCNEFCYFVGEHLGAAAQVDFFDRMGLFDAIPGLLPAERDRIPVLLHDPPKSLAIGGGSVFCTPVRAAGLAASLGLGRVVHPHLVRLEGAESAIGPEFASAANLGLVRSGMRDVVGPRGTAARHQRELAPFRIAAKTGTADYGSPETERLQQAWFVGFAPADPADRPEWAFAIVRTNTTRQGADVAGLSEGVLKALGEVFPEKIWW